MINNETNPLVEDVPLPVIKESGAIVENIFPVAGTEKSPDLAGQDIMAEYLIERIDPSVTSTRIRVVLTATGHTIPGFSRVPSGAKEVTRLHKAQEWLVKPRLALGITLGSMALFNTVGNYPSVAGAARYIGHEIQRTFVPLPEKEIVKHERVNVPGQVKHIGLTAATGELVGSTVIDSAVTREFVTNVKHDLSSGGNLVNVTITGNTSDEWNGDSSIGIPSPQNIQLGYDRAQAAVRQLENEGLNINPSILKVKETEHVISEENKSKLLSEAQADGFDSISAAIDAVDNGEAVPQPLANKIKWFFTGKQDRGVSMDATVEFPARSHVVIKDKIIKVPAKDHVPSVPKPNWYWFIPMVPIRRRERYQKIKQMHRWQLTPSSPIYRPQIIHENDDQAWLRIRPEAVKDDGALVDNAWAYTRKYEYLMRDDRIVDLLRADFKDASGEEKSLRVLFVDKTPAQETVAAFEALLAKFASMQGGKLGDRVSGIFVYPSESAGIGHRDPRRVALGIDQQSLEHCLGTYTYPLKLIELHMPTSVLDPEELEEILNEFNGPRWVMSHEVGGHATDRNDNPQTLRRVLARGIPNAHVIDGDARAYKMLRLGKVLRKLPNSSSKEEIFEYDITYPVLDASGKKVTVKVRVKDNDPRLAHASESTIVGYRPTRYAGQNDSEHYAETAAAVTTGIPIPYEETGKKVTKLKADDGSDALFATGYRPDAKGQSLFTEAVGGKIESYPLDFDEPTAIRIRHINPANDPLIRRELLRTRRARVLRPEEMVAILARVVRRKR